jgi:hypothetical protein
MGHSSGDALNAFGGAYRSTAVFLDYQRHGWITKPGGAREKGEILMDFEAKNEPPVGSARKLPSNFKRYAKRISRFAPC